LYSIVTGLFAGLLGIGGGLVIVPLLLELGLFPLMVSTTSSFCVLFTSSLNIAGAIIEGKLDSFTAIVMGGSAFLGSLLIS